MEPQNEQAQAQPQEQQQPAQSQEPAAPAPEQSDTQVQQPQESVPAQDQQNQPEQQQVDPSLDQQVQPQESSISESEVEDYSYGPQQGYQPQPIDWNQLPRDPNDPNAVDPNAFVDVLNQQLTGAVAAARDQARQEFAQQRQEEKLWNDAVKAHPELESNHDLRNDIHRARIGGLADQVARGIQNAKMETPKQVADRILKQYADAKKAGYAQAQQNVQVQEGAHLETSNVADSGTSNLNRGEAMAQVGSDNPHEKRAAVDALLKDMFDRGDLTIGR